MEKQWPQYLRKFHNNKVEASQYEQQQQAGYSNRGNIGLPAELPAPDLRNYFPFPVVHANRRRPKNQKFSHFPKTRADLSSPMRQGNFKFPGISPDQRSQCSPNDNVGNRENFTMYRNPGSRGSWISSPSIHFCPCIHCMLGHQGQRHFEDLWNQAKVENQEVPLNLAYKGHQGNEGILMPRIARARNRNVPVHIDVGGTKYSSSLDTLRRYPDSVLCQMFNGTFPIVWDSRKQHYFIDRDGEMFRHILNYLRFGRLVLPKDFAAHDLLRTEALYYGLQDIVKDLDNYKNRMLSSSVDSRADIRCDDTSTKVVAANAETPQLVEQVDGYQIKIDKATEPMEIEDSLNEEE